VTAFIPYLERFCFVRLTRVSATLTVERKTLCNLIHLLLKTKGYSDIINFCCILLYLQFRTHYQPCTLSITEHFTDDVPLCLRIHWFLNGKLTYLHKFGIFSYCKTRNVFCLNKFFFFLCR